MRRIRLTICLLALGFGCRAAPDTDPVGLDMSASANFAVQSPTSTIEATATEPPSLVVPASFTSSQPVMNSSPSPVQLTLFSTITTALARNPDLVALRETEPVGQAALDAATFYPFNPSVQAAVFPYGEDSDGNSTSVSNQVQIVQTFELAHQQRYRVAGGVANLSRVQQTIAAAELQTVAATERSYFAALYYRALADQAGSIADANEALVGVMQRRFESNQATAADLATASVDAWSSRQQQQLAEIDLSTALDDLRRQLNLPSDTPLEIGEDLSTWRWAPAFPTTTPETPLGSLPNDQPAFTLGSEAEDASVRDQIERLVAVRPDILAAHADVAAAEAALSLAVADRKPNLQFGPAYERDDAGTLLLGVTGQMDLPVVNNGTPLVRQRQTELRQALVAADQLEQKARLEAEGAVHRYEQARRLAERTQAGMATVLPDPLRQIENLFQAGQVDVLRVYAARNTLLAVRRAQLDSLYELALAAADVTATTALAPDELIQIDLDGPQPQPPPVAIPEPLPDP